MRLALVMATLMVVACTTAQRAPAATPASASPAAPGSPSPSGGPEILPILVSSEITKGPNRFLFSLTDRENRLVAAPDVRVHLLFYDVDTAPDTVVFEADGEFLWAIEGEAGLYKANIDFPDAGRWGTRFTATFPDGRTETVRADYDVAKSGTTPAVGAKVPAVDTPTTADVGGNLRQITTDRAPDPRFYETSISDAVAAGRPFVAVFATPAFCETRLCGPTLETVKVVAKDFPEITFINVEPYRMVVRDGALQPELDPRGQLQPAPWTEAWGLKVEPYTFLVRADGTLAAKFEGVLGPEELRAALKAL